MQHGKFYLIRESEMQVTELIRITYQILNYQMRQCPKPCYQYVHCVCHVTLLMTTRQSILLSYGR